MNVTELYRELKMTKDEFFATVQELGFDIGERAIKIDDGQALKIIKAIQAHRKASQKKSIFADGTTAAQEDMDEAADGGDGESDDTPLPLPDKITVSAFAELLEKRVADMVAILMQNGIMATINETLDYETAAIIAEDLGYAPHLSLENAGVDNTDDRAELVATTLGKEKKSALKDRPPVIVIVGHVDHGKTTLLDTIREANVTEGESGGITQHIGAYQVEKNNRLLTFIDTPGHEAFTAMRSRGARVADVAVLVVAADDGIKPQTIESIHILQEAELPFIVAINKVDKPAADVDRVKKELSELNLIPEDYGGDTICVPVSAKEGLHIDDLLETLILVSDVQKENIVANPEGDCVATIIESHVDKHTGAIATLLVQNGTLRIGDIVQVGSTPGKIRSMKDWHGTDIKEAKPSTPVQVLGLKGAPVVGDILQVVKDKKVLKQNTKRYDSFSHMKGSADDEEDKNALPIILRADKLGSLEAIIESLQAITHKEVRINIIQKGLGSITENDITLAAASNALVLGFHAGITSGAEKYAVDEDVEVFRYNIIYELIDKAKEELEALLEKEIVYEKVGSLKILAVFKSEKTYTICGGRVENGIMRHEAPVKILRKGKMIGEGVVLQLQENKKNAKEVKKGNECGMRISTETPMQEGDILEVYEAQEKERTLSGK